MRAFCRLLVSAVVPLALLSCAAAPEATPETPAASASEAGAATSKTSTATSRTGTAAKAAKKEPLKAYKPAPPPSDDFDWLRTTSGEWIKGKITVLREDSLEFDSDEFDDVVLDWDDVAELRSPRRNALLIDQRTVVEGTIQITESEAVVLTDDGERRFERSRVRTIIPGGATEGSYWSGKLNLGFTTRSGNTDQTDLSVIGGITRRTPLTRLTLDYNGAVSIVQDIETINNHRLTGKVDVFLTKRFYVIPFMIDYFRDKFQNIEHRIVPGAGAGLHIFDTKRVEWDIEGGLAARYEEYFSVEPGEPSTETTGAVLFSTRLDVELTKRLDFEFKYSAQIGVDDLRNTNQHASFVFEFELTEILDLDLALYWDRTGQPRALADGTVPEQDDFRTHIGIGLDF